jgi:hypothetical protein
LEETGFYEPETSEWVLKKIRSFSKFMGMLCDKFEGNYAPFRFC